MVIAILCTLQDGKSSFMFYHVWTKMCRHEKIVLWDHKLYDNERYCYGEIECEVHKLSFYGRPFIKKISRAS